MLCELYGLVFSCINTCSDAAYSLCLASSMLKLTCGFQCRLRSTLAVLLVLHTPYGTGYSLASIILHWPYKAGVKAKFEISYNSEVEDLFSI